MKTLSIILTLFISIHFLAQENTAAVISVYTNGVRISPTDAESLLRFELTKTEKYKVFDKLDMVEIAKEKEISMADCYGKNCLLNIGKEAKVDKVFTGSIEHFGKKVVVTVKILDVATGNYDKTVTEEFINLEDEIQLMVQVTLFKALGIKNDQLLLEKLVYYNEPLQIPTTHTNNNGPRMGIAYIGGEFNRVLTDPEKDGGYNVQPIMSQFGYQLEGVYLSSGNFQALVEGLVLVTGVEQGLFNPSLVFMNGFRSSKNGWEVAFGPSINFKRSAKGFYDDNNAWHLESDWNNDWGTNPFETERRLDKRGDLIVAANWVWAVGKTFHSGYLNIPVNAYFSHSKDGWITGLSVGFNIAKKD